MKKKLWIKTLALTMAFSLCAMLTLSACSMASNSGGAAKGTPPAGAPFGGEEGGGTVSASTDAAAYRDGAGMLDTASLFTERDLRQDASLGDAVTLTVSDGQDVSITEEGVYRLTGTAENATVTVEADGTAKVQLVLDGLTITNSDFPCIYVVSADKVFVTTVSDSSLSVTGSFRSDGDTRTDGVIFSRDDLVLNGTATLTLTSSDNGVVGKDELKITGGSYVITAADTAVEAKDAVYIAGGSLSLTAGNDGVHAENGDDDSKGIVYVSGGSLEIRAGDDGIHAQSLVQIDGGELTITAAEGVEGTYVQLNDGVITITASDDGVNGAQKSSAYRATVEINGGELTIAMGAGDTDGIDVNGDLYINGGTIRITGSSGFDYDGTAYLNGGAVYLNGQQLSSIPNQMMGGPGQGGWGGPGQGGPGGGGRH